ncbi:MAG TPA: hypothetical protein VM661_17025 [Candidatus Sulfotelmatobacter sp.]|jgi:hypothetical protein|nr:hypothetical protein [Candidatus Sulfotelmatobacter sp.]
MAIYSFGSGTLWGVRSDTANATPIKFGTLHDVNLEFSATAKQLFGQYQFPVAVARGTSKITGKAKFAQVQGRAFAELFFGSALQSGQVTTANAEAASVPAAAPYTASVIHAADFVQDLGVVNAATGLPFTKVASSPAQGEYVTADGVYGFNVVDAGAGLLISYGYSASSGQKMVVSNQLLGVQPVFQVALETNYSAPGGLKKAVLTLNACVSNKLAFATKQDDFSIPEMDFEAFADAANNVLTWSFSEAS